MDVRVSLTGPVSIEGNGARLDERSFPGRQGRLVLAYLLAEEGRPVPRDELAAVLWGDVPPAKWEKALSVLVSKLRALLEECGVDGQAALRSAFGCYQLTLPAGTWIDVAAVREAADAAERALDAGDVGAAREFAAEAAALARRGFLPGEDGLWIDEIRRELSELLVRALECLVDASLADGDVRGAVRHAEELTTLEPFREGGYRRLMQAHAAAGDDAEALRVYERCRLLLADELGAYPSSETESIYRELLRGTSLAQGRAESDETAPYGAVGRGFEPSASFQSRPESTSTRRYTRRLVFATALVLAVAGGGAVWSLTRPGESTVSAGAFVLDPETKAVTDTVPLGTAPSSVAIGDGSAWIVDADDGTITEVDLETRKAVRTFSPGTVPVDLAVQGKTVWIANASRAGAFPESVSRLEAESGVVDAVIELPPSPGGHDFNVFAGFSRQFVAAAPDAVWVIGGAGRVSRIDPRTNAVVATLRDVRAQNIAVGEGRVYVTEASGVAELDPSTNTVARRTELEAEYLAGLAIGAGAVWVADPLGGVVWRIGTSAPPSKRSIELGLWVAGLAFGERSLWATNEIGDAVYRVDPQTGRGEVVHRASAPRAVAADEGAVWVTAAAPPARDSSLSSAVCRDVIFEGRGTPDLLIVSDLPLKGDSRASTRPMTQGIELALRQRDFEAGGYTVGYQSCDSATGQAGVPDVFRCGTNAKAFARNLSVVGVIGSYTSPCSYFQIPIANEAPDGPLVMISPSNTFSGLTLDEELYPTGTRNYVRIAAVEHLEAVAHAELARTLSRRRLVTLTPSGDDFYGGFAENVEAAASRIGVEIVGKAVYEAEGRSFAALARRVRQMRPEAVSVADILRPSSATLLRDLRAALGPKVALIVPDGFAPFGEELTKLVGRATDTLYVTYYGYPNRLLPPRGKQFLASFARTNGGERGPDFAAAYGAQAAEILLDAIARSDGTRASVTGEVRRTRIANGILGDISFDRNGDLVSAPVTAYRVGPDRFVVDRVVIARSALLRKGAARE